MEKFHGIPIGLDVGPGSQPGVEDDDLAILSMPSGMETFMRPVMPEPEEVIHLTAGKQVLEDILSALRAYSPQQPVQSIDLSDLDAANLELVNQTLGEGEVSAVYDGPSPIRAQEAVLPGVWRVHHFDTRQQLIHDCIEIGAAPALAIEAFTQSGRSLNADFNPNDPTIQNAPALLVELADKIGTYQAGDVAHVINLSLLPLSDGDLALLGERLGVGPVTLLSRGYGNCRIGSTAKANTWWIKYFNSQDLLILNTIEVVDLPAVAKAAPEDIEDSAHRLDEMLELYR